MALTYGELECAVLEWGVVGAEYDGVPDHDVVVARRAGNTGRGILLEFGNSIYSPNFNDLQSNITK